MDLGTHIAVGVITASAWPSLSLTQRTLVVLFAILPDCTESLHYFSLKKYNGDSHYGIQKYNDLSADKKNIYSWVYNLLHSILTPTIFFILSLIFDWPLVYSLMWFGHLLIDLPSHKHKLGLKLWWPLSSKRLKGLFDWWEVKFFNGWELWGYLVLVFVMCSILIKNFW